MTLVAGKEYDLNQLEAELIAAGVPIRALGTDRLFTQIFTYDAAGDPVPLPPAAAAILAAHVAPPVPAKPNYGNDPADLDRQAAQAATQLRAFIANATPTNAEVVAQAKLNARIILALMRRSGL
jgi:hypothetical protein